MSNRPPSSSGYGWRSEAEYYLARLGVSLGVIDQRAVSEALRLQGQALANGQALDIGTVFVRANLLAPAALVRLKHELLRCHHPCPRCRQSNYFAPSNQPRHEACRRCGAPLSVHPTDNTSGSMVLRRESALRESPEAPRFQQNPLEESSANESHRFGDYVLEEAIARGGMGAIYRVRHGQTGRVYALKVLLAAEKASERQIHRFKREAKAQLELDHPNIVKIHDAGEWEGILYYAGDLVEGRDLAECYRSLPREERVRVLAKVAHAVQHAHDHGYLHRDLKPANVLIDAQGEPRLTDFGLAKNLGGQTQLTQEGAVMGTPYYMSPEQATGQVDTLGPHTDVFSLGVLLYELVSGHLPFVADSALELYRMIVELPPATFAELDVNEPELEQIALRAMQKDPALRYESAGALAEDLERVLRGEKPTASQVSRAQVMARRVERHKLSLGVLVGGGLLGLLVLVGLAVGFKVAREAFLESQARAARDEAAKAATFALQQAGTDAETLPPREAVRGLDEALAAARTALAGEGPEPESLPALRTQLREAFLSRARLALGLGSGSEAAAARECLEELAALSGADEPGLERPRLQLLARAAWRLGDRTGAEDVVVALEAGGEEAMAPYLRGRWAAEEGRWEEALAGFTAAATRAAEAEALLGEALVAQALALRRLERESEAETSWRAATDLLGDAAHGLLGELLWVEGDLRAAADAYARLLEAQPGDILAAGRLVQGLLTLGAPSEALVALQQARRRRPGLPAHELLELRIRVHLGEDPREALGEQGDEPAALLLSADVAAALGEADAYAGFPAEAPPELLAARLRWRARRGDPAELREEATALGASLALLPHDRPGDPALGRAWRDLGWVRLALEEVAGARAAAEAALRGLPGDLDTCYLLARADPAALPRLEQAFLREAEALDGSLGRGLFLGRLARLHRDGELATAAGRLLTLRLAGDWELEVAWRELQRLEHPAPDNPPEPGEGPSLLDEARLLPGLPDHRAVDATKRLEAKRLMARAERLDDPLEIMPFCEQALAADPFNEHARRKLAEESLRVSAEAESMALGARAFQLTPGKTLRFLLWRRYKWREAYQLTESKSPAELTAQLLAGEGAQDPTRHVEWIFDRYLAMIYPEDTKPRWTRAPLRDVVARIDRVLRQDPQLSGLLYLRAHLTALDGRLRAARRDLAVASRVKAGVRGEDRREPPYLDLLYRAWVLSPEAPADAAQLLHELRKLPIYAGGKTFARLRDWMKDDPRFEALRRQSAWAPFWRGFKREE